MASYQRHRVNFVPNCCRSRSLPLPPSLLISVSVNHRSYIAGQSVHCHDLCSKCVAMVKIQVPEDHQELTTTTFVRRSSTPLIKSMCVNCQTDHLPTANQMTIKSSFLKWEKRLALPILYQRTSSVDHSIYTPMGQTREKFPLQQNNFVNSWSGDLFLDPAVMGIKRGSAKPPPPPQLTFTTGVDFIKNFHLIFQRHRQCSFIEAHMMRDSAQRRQQRLV